MPPLEQSWTVCIVDDDDSVRRGLTRLMRANGLEAKSYASAESFLEIARSVSRVCVLLDITMPRMSGLQLQERLREQGVSLPIIAISAHEDEEARSSARAMGARFFLRKPVDESALLDAIAWVTGGST